MIVTCTFRHFIMTRKEYMKNYQREWVRKRRLNYFKYKVCSNCLSTHKLEIHHIDRETKVNNSIWSWKEERRLAELLKCIILCEKCHQLETNNQIKEWAAKPIPHGTQSGYRRGCRCNNCLVAYKEARRIHYLNTGN